MKYNKKRWLALLLTLCMVLTMCPISSITAQAAMSVTINETNFPDEIFRNYISSNFDDGDGILSEDEIQKVTWIDISNNEISNLKGIEYFTSLEYLDCSYNQLTSLDVSKNIELESLGCGYNQLTSLDVSKNIELESLGCDSNQLTELDVSKNILLKYLRCGDNFQLTELDVSKNTELEWLFCSGNGIQKLDISKNTSLKSLGCNLNPLTELDVSKNTALEDLFCNINGLTELDVSKNTELKYLECFGNQLTSLDISKNIALESLDCSSNQLTSLDVSQNTELNYISAYGNTYYIGTVPCSNEIKLSLPKGFDDTRTSNWSGATYDSTTGILKITTTDNYVTYDYDSGNNKTVSFKLSFTHTNHTLISTLAKDATCTENGNIAYWTCSSCGKCFSDADGKTEITKEQTVVSAKGHTYVAVDKDAKEHDKTITLQCSVCADEQYNQYVTYTDNDVQLLETTTEPTYEEDSESKYQITVTYDGKQYVYEYTVVSPKLTIDYEALKSLINEVQTNLKDGKYNGVNYTTSSIDALRMALLNAKKVTKQDKVADIQNAYQELKKASTVGEGGLVVAAKNITVSFADTGVARGTCVGNGWYAIGDTVTLKVTPSVGYVFDRWTKDAEGKNKIEGAGKEYTFTIENENTQSTYYIWLNEKKYTVSFTDVDGGKAVADKTDYSYKTTATITAMAGENYEFVGWKNSNGITVSTANPYSFPVLGSQVLTPEFVKTVNDQNEQISYVTVNFYHQSGNLLSSQKLVLNSGIATAPTSPTKIGYTFVGWSEKKSGATLEDVIALDSKTFDVDTNLYPVFTLETGKTYSVTVDGTVVKSDCEPQTSVTVTADSIVGKKFVGCKNANGDYVSYDSTYTFIITGDTVLTTEYVELDSEIEKTPTITMDAPIYEDITDGYKMTFYFNYNLPEGYKLVDVGTLRVANKDFSEDGITFDTDNVTQWSLQTTGGVENQFYFAKSNYYGIGTTVCGYMIYEDIKGVRNVIYTQAIYGIKDSVN